MYMMSTGKAEISKLNTAMDETAKVVQELKAELSKRKSSRNHKDLSSKTKINMNQIKVAGTEIGDNVQALLVPEEGECASSVLTEEPNQEVHDIDSLEAELESELQKLPWCSTEASGVERKISDSCENDSSVECCKPDGQNPNSYQLNSVLPSELDQKLCHLLIERQESQIVELESELCQAQSKLHEREAELQTLKDCVRRLTDFSLANASDEETDARLEEYKRKDEDYDVPGPESQRWVVGMKRAMDFESYSCHIE